jgi:hypothetical protein
MDCAKTSRIPSAKDVIPGDSCVGADKLAWGFQARVKSGIYGR